MNDMKYVGRSYLVDYDLSLGLFECFNLKVHDLIPIKTGFLIKTDDGDKLLKKMDCSIDDLNFIDSGIKYTGNNFDRIAGFTKADGNKIYKVWDKDIYCVMDLIEGRVCKYSSEEDIAIVARGLGELHNASEGFRYKLPSRYKCGKLIDNFNRKLEEIRFFKQIVKFNESSRESKRKFDELFINNVEEYIKQIENSINIIVSSQYYKLCSEEDKTVLCHNNFDHHNIIINNNKAYFMNFNNAVIDIKVSDVCNFMKRVVKSCDYDISKAEIILNNYSLSNNLNKRELEVLYGMMCFPEGFYNISKDYYTRRKPWDEDVFEFKFKDKMKDIEKKKVFLEQFNKMIS